MARTNVTLETALGQLLAETRLGQEKAAAKGYARVSAKPSDPVATDLRKLATLLRTAPEPGVTYEDLNRVKEAVYGKR